MSITKKFYSFTDPISKQITKDVGWLISQEVTRSETVVVNGQPVTTNSLPVNVTYNFAPNRVSLNPTEIDEAAFNALNVSGESMSAADTRQRHEIQYERVAFLMGA